MSALSTLTTYIRRDFKRTDKSTEITQAINDMMLWIAVHMLVGNYKFQSWINTVVRQEDYPLPTNMIHLYHPIRLLLGSASSDSGYQLDHLTKEQFDLREPNPNRTTPTTGRPSAYTVFSKSILLTPLPDSATYQLEINWSKRPTSLSADADTPSLGAEWDEVIKQGALERLYAGMGMMEEANYWASQYRDGDGEPVGFCRKLFSIERDREEILIGRVVNNDL